MTYLGYITWFKCKIIKFVFFFFCLYSVSSNNCQKIIILPKNWSYKLAVHRSLFALWRCNYNGPKPLFPLFIRIFSTLSGNLSVSSVQVSYSVLPYSTWYASCPHVSIRVIFLGFVFWFLLLLFYFNGKLKEVRDWLTPFLAPPPL